MSVARLGFVLWFLANMAAASAAHDSARHVMGPADNYVYELAAPGSYGDQAGTRWHRARSDRRPP